MNKRDFIKALLGVGVVRLPNRAVPVAYEHRGLYCRRCGYALAVVVGSQASQKPCVTTVQTTEELHRGANVVCACGETQFCQPMVPARLV